MQDSTETIVFEADLEVEANIYQELLTEAGVFAQVRPVEDPLLTNIIRQIALPRYQIVVSNSQAEIAKSIIAEQQHTVVDIVPEEEEEDEEPIEDTTQKSMLLIIRRILIWLFIAGIIFMIYFTMYNHSHNILGG